MILDYSVFPDLDELPGELVTNSARADYIARICGAWDFGIAPLRETFQLLREWRTAFDEFPLIDSPAYAAFRTVFGWAPIGGGRAQRAHYEQIDARQFLRDDVCRDCW